jgi:hypothetical protein
MSRFNNGYCNAFHVLLKLQSGGCTRPMHSLRVVCENAASSDPSPEKSNDARYYQESVPTEFDVHRLWMTLSSGFLPNHELKTGHKWSPIRSRIHFRRQQVFARPGFHR